MADLEPTTHLEKYIAGALEPVTHLEKVIAKYGGGGGGGSDGGTIRIYDFGSSNAIESDYAMVDDFYIAGDARLSLESLLKMERHMRQLRFGGNVEWNNPFELSETVESTIMLYDFSGCTSVPTLDAAYMLPHADGCIIRIPANLSTEWRSAPGWSDLTDISWETIGG